MDQNNAFSKILIVDSVPLNQDAVKGVLSGKDYMVYTANSGRSALAMAKAYKLDLILLEKSLPDIDGFEICRQLKSNNLTMEIPVIFLIENQDKNGIIQLFKLGAVDYVSKPFSNEELLARVAFHLDLKKNKEELILSKKMAEAANKAKAIFLANISHEIRTPMNGIIGMIDILKQTPLNSEQQDYIEIIGISGENLLMIINDVLDFSKIEAGQITFERIRFNLSDEVTEVVKILRYKAIQKNLDFTFHIDLNVPEFLVGDPLRLKQVLLNLCNNALKFTPRGFVKITVKPVSLNDSTVKLYFEVQDTGIGISSENQSKLFKSFAQAEVSTTREYGGTGLGLAISKNLVELMNGNIGIRSEEGNGSTFYFDCEFGVSTLVQSESENKEPDEIRRNGKKLKILLAEDNIINQKVAILNLQKLGHSVIVASDGREAFDKFKNENPDVILMDIQMSGMDGVEATGIIREWELGQKVSVHVPIVAMTANTLKSDKELFQAAGMDDYLCKPFTVSDLIHVLERVNNH